MSSIRVELQLRDGSFTTGVLRAGQTIAQFQKELARTDKHFEKISKSGGGFVRSVQRADEHSRTLLSTLRDISIVSGAVTLAFGALTGAAGGIVGDIIKVNSEMERLRHMMMGMSTASEPMAEAARNVAYLREQVTKMPFSLKELSSTFVKLKATGIDPTTGSMQALADGIAAFGGGDEQLHRVTLGIAQMSGKGVIQMEEMRQQLGESMPNAMQIMARSMGVSVAELTAAIGTGTVEAKSALEKFYGELERAYGGSAQRLMETFSGQVTKLQANLQLLATGDGMSAFFDVQKDALKQLNEFLESDKAKEFAKNVGNALAGLVQMLKRAAEVAYDFRAEIFALAKVGAAALTVTALTRSVRALHAALTVGRLEMGAFWVSMAAGSGHMKAGIANMVAMGVTARNTTVLFGGLRVAMMGVATGLATFAPWLTLLAGALGILASKMGLFGDKTGDAYENLKKLGAESREQANEILSAREAQLRGNIDDRQSEYDWDFNAPRYKTGKLDAINAAKQELADFLKERQEILKDADRKESQERAEAFEEGLDERKDALRRTYNEEQVELDKKYQAELASAVESGKAVASIREGYQADMLANQRALTEGVIAIYDDEIAALKKRAVGASDFELKQIEDILSLLRAKRVEAQQELNGIGDLGIDMLEAPESLEKKVEKGAQLLNSLRDDIADVETEMLGASGAAAKLNAQIARGDFGSIEEGGALVEKLHEDLREAVAAKEALDKITDGREDAQRDLDKIRTDNLEREMKLREEMAGGDLSDAERFQLRLDTGYYEGLGPIENIRKAVNGVIDSMILQGDTQTELGRSMREDTFSEFTIGKIDSVADAVGRVNREMLALGSNIGSVNFGKFGLGFGASNPVFGSSSSSLLELIKSVESKGDYNATLDNGRWTGGPVSLVDKTLNEILEIQKQMLANPENRALYGDGLGSSALGAYQIVSKTLRGLIADLGLTGDELFTPELQDRMAKTLAEARGADVEGLRAEWAGLKNVSAEAILSAFRGVGPTKANAATLSEQGTAASLPAVTPFNSADAATRRARLEADAIAETERLSADAAVEAQKSLDLEGKEKSLTAHKYLEDLKAKAAGAKVETEELGVNYAKLVELVEKGEFGASKNIADYKELAAAAQKLDEVEKKLKETRQANKDAEKQRVELEQQGLEIAQKIADERERAKDPDYIAQSEDLRRLNEELNEYVENVRIGHGDDSPEYTDALARKQELLASHRLLEAESRKADLAAERSDIEESMLSVSTVRANALQKDLKRLDDWVKEARAAGIDEIEITQFVEEQKALLRARYERDTNPITAQMEEWGDATGRLMENTTSWLDGLSTGMVDIFTGKGASGLKSAIDSMLSDVIGSAFKYIYAQNFGGKTSALAEKGFGASAGGKKAIVPGVAHGGGIVGSLGRTRAMPASIFANAPKFHGGGIIGQKLLPSERPTITKVGEGVFTPEQMKALAPAGSGGQSISISAPVTVNGSAGTPEQNADLADRMAREMEGTMRGVVIDELKRQMRPGNMIGNVRR